MLVYFTFSVNLYGRAVSSDHGAEQEFGKERLVEADDEDLVHLIEDTQYTQGSDEHGG